jgi:hypothetical protein
MAADPAASVLGPWHTVKAGRTPVLPPKGLSDGIDATTVADAR